MDTKIIELRQAALALPSKNDTVQLSAKSEVLRLSELIDAELAQLRATVAAQAERISAMVDDFSIAEICEALGIDDNDDRTPSQIVSDAAHLLTQNADYIAAQAEQLRNATNLIRRMWEMADAETSTIDIEPESLVWKIEADTRAWLAANAPQTPEEQPALLTESGYFTNWPTEDEMPTEESHDRIDRMMARLLHRAAHRRRRIR